MSDIRIRQGEEIKRLRAALAKSEAENAEMRKVIEGTVGQDIEEWLSNKIHALITKWEAQDADES